MLKPENPRNAVEGIIKLIIFIDVIFLISFFFVDNFKHFCLVIILTNLGFLVMRIGIKKDMGKIEAYVNKK